MEILEWLQDWYSNQCDGEWEHSYGIRIDTLDNPGWEVTIDLIKTKIEGKEIPYQLIDKGENDWYGLSIKNNQFVGIGDPSKLIIILARFREVIEDSIK
jgi:hypothetical protein